MTGKEMIEMVKRNPIVRAAIPLETELQWPKLTIEQKKLCVQFYFCHTRLTGEFLRVDPPLYVGKFSYPFHHVVLLEDLSYRKDSCKRSPGWIPVNEENVGRIKKNAELLFQSLDCILIQYEEKGIVEEGMLNAYHTIMEQVIPPEHKSLYFQE